MAHLFSVLLMLHGSFVCPCVTSMPSVLQGGSSLSKAPDSFSKSTQHKAASMLVQIQAQKHGTASQIEPLFGGF